MFVALARDDLRLRAHCRIGRPTSRRSVAAASHARATVARCARGARRPAATTTTGCSCTTPRGPACRATRSAGSSSICATTSRRAARGAGRGHAEARRRRRRCAARSSPPFRAPDCGRRRRRRCSASACCAAPSPTGRALRCTDEAQAVEALGLTPRLVRGSPANLKITFADDLSLAAAILAAQGGAIVTMRIGTGFDVHALVAGRPLVIGGVTIPHPRGLDGHSDADVLLHAICDALLGALALGDLGAHFPDSDRALEGRRQPRAAAPRVVARDCARLRRRQRRRDSDRAGAEARAVRRRDARERRRRPGLRRRLRVDQGDDDRAARLHRARGRYRRGGGRAARAARASTRSSRSGSVTRATVPPPSRGNEVEAARRAARAMRSTIARPSPAPAAPSARARASLARVNGCFSRSTSAGAMPGPRSATSMQALRVAHGGRSPRPAARRRRARCRRDSRRGARSRSP